jgi:hypothetical protein
VSAINIEDAESFAARLAKAGIPAEPIHQKLNRGERELRIRRLRSGRIRCLVHVQLLCEGIDLPWLEWLALRRPVGSPVRLVQEVGRQGQLKDPATRQLEPALRWLYAAFQGKPRDGRFGPVLDPLAAHSSPNWNLAEAGVSAKFWT